VQPLPASYGTDEIHDLVETYYWFVTHFIRGAAGRTCWTKNCFMTEDFSERVDPVDEAFAILLYENNYDKWCSMAKTDDGRKTKATPATKYTQQGTIWTEEGYIRFGVIYRTVVRNRKKDPKRLWDASLRSDAQRRAPHQPDIGGSRKRVIRVILARTRSVLCTACPWLPIFTQ